MKISVSHDLAEESIEAKTRSFKSLSPQERMELMCSVIDLALDRNPRIADFKDAEQTARGIRILSEARR